MDFTMGEQCGELVWQLQKQRQRIEQLVTEYETSFIQTPPEGIPSSSKPKTPNSAKSKDKPNKRKKHKMADKDKQEEKEDPWMPQAPLFMTGDDKAFNDKVQYVLKYVAKLAKCLHKEDGRHDQQNEWKVIAKVVNRFFLVTTVVSFSVTAVLFYLLTAYSQ